MTAKDTVLSALREELKRQAKRDSPRTWREPDDGIEYFGQSAFENDVVIDLSALAEAVERALNPPEEGSADGFESSLSRAQREWVAQQRAMLAALDAKMKEPSLSPMAEAELAEMKLSIAEGIACPPGFEEPRHPEGEKAVEKAWEELGIDDDRTVERETLLRLTEGTGPARWMGVKDEDMTKEELCAFVRYVMAYAKTLHLISDPSL